MAIPQPKPLDLYSELMALPANMVGEIVNGSLHAHPRPAPRHGKAASRLGFTLGGPFDLGNGGPGGWVFIVEPELHLGEHVLVPDIAAWRRERLPKLPSTAYFETTPDWLCEVLSPSTAQIDRTDKLDTYAEFNVGDCWYIDPAAMTLEVFELHDGRWPLLRDYKDSNTISAPPFETHAFDLSVLWEQP
jgi:Uma2 family endonuclease